MPASTSACTLPSVTAGIVKSTATWAPDVGQDGEVVAGVDRGDELEVRCTLDGTDDGLSHAARRTQHGHPDAFAHGGKPYPPTSVPTACASRRSSAGSSPVNRSTSRGG